MQACEKIQPLSRAMHRAIMPPTLPPRPRVLPAPLFDIHAATILRLGLFAQSSWPKRSLEFKRPKSDTAFQNTLRVLANTAPHVPPDSNIILQP